MAATNSADSCGQVLSTPGQTNKMLPDRAIAAELEDRRRRLGSNRQDC